MNDCRASSSPSQWLRVPIRALGKLHCGQSPSSSDVNSEGHGTPYVTGPEQWDGYKLVEPKWTTKPRRIAPANSIFITVKGSVGEVFPGIRAAIGRDIYAFEPHLGIDARFVYRAIQFSIQDILGHAHGDIPGLSKKHILEHHINVPGTKTQRSVASKIDELFSRIDEGERALERVQKLLERYRQSVLKDAVTGELTREWREKQNGRLESGNALVKRILKSRREAWEKVERGKMTRRDARPIGKQWKEESREPSAIDAAQLPSLPQEWTWSSLGTLFRVSVGSTPSRKVPEYWNGGIPWVSSGEVAFCRIGSTKETISQLGYENSSVKLHPKGTVLLAMIGEGKTRGQAAILDINACHNQNAASLDVAATQIPPEYVYRFLESRYESVRKIGQGGNQPALNSDLVKRIAIPVPPLAEMTRICDAMDRQMIAVDGIQAELKSQRDRITALRQATLQAAFRGELAEHDVTDEPAAVLLEQIKESQRQAHTATGVRKRGRAA